LKASRREYTLKEVDPRRGTKREIRRGQPKSGPKRQKHTSQRSHSGRKDTPIAYKECVVGFAIRVDKGNNTKLAFDKKLMEGLEFIQQYVDKRACFLPHEKDKKLEPIRAKNDMPKYQVVMKGYFRIPNNNSFSNV
jgi:hypothetical protein